MQEALNCVPVTYQQKMIQERMLTYRARIREEAQNRGAITQRGQSESKQGINSEKRNKSPDETAVRANEA